MIRYQKSSENDVWSGKMKGWVFKGITEIMLAAKLKIQSSNDFCEEK
jgi:hypothetical protein